MFDVDPKFYLPRLPRIFYQADAMVHWEMTMAHRAAGWLTDSSHARFREVMLHTAVREQTVLPFLLPQARSSAPPMDGS